MHQETPELNCSRTSLALDSTLVVAVEMSLSTWLVCAEVPGLDRRAMKKMSVDEAELLSQLHRWRDEAEKRLDCQVSRICVAYEAGRDGFWLAHVLRGSGIEAHVMHSTSIPVKRDHRRAKTDRLDCHLMMRDFLGWLRREAGHCRMVAVPTAAQEDARRVTREPKGLVREQTKLINRLKVMFACLGIRDFKPHLKRAPERLDGLLTPEGDPNITTHLDETGFRTEEKLHWVHTTSSKTMSHFRVGNSRGDILLDLAGNVIHDCYAPYWKILGVKHGTCNFHITRELKALFEIDNEPWAGEMRIILFDALKLTDNAREQGKDAVDPKDISAIEERFYACLKKAIAYHESLDPLVSPTDKKKRGRKKRRIGHNLAIRLLKFDESVLLFLHDLNVPFSNNEAERDLRMIKVRQKVSGCFRTKQGLENFCILRSIVETARKQGWDILETLQKPPDELIRMIEAA